MIWRLLGIWFVVVCVSGACAFLGGFAIVQIENRSFRAEQQQQVREGLITESEMADNIKINEAYGGMASVIFPLITLILSAIATAPIVANCAAGVRRNKWLRFVSFFLLPLVAVAIFCAEGVNANGLYSFAPMYVPYFVCLTVAYIRFSRKYRNYESTAQV